MHTKSPWDIQAPSVSQHLEAIRLGQFEEGSLATTATFTILRNARRNETEIAEFVAATGTKNPDIGNMVTLHFDRLVFFETIAAIETEIQMREEALKPIVLDIYRNHMKQGLAGKAFLKEKEASIQKSALWETMRIMEQVSNAIDNPEQKERLLSLGSLETEAMKTFETIKSRLLSGEYKPAEIIFDENGEKVVEPTEEITASNVNSIALALTEKIINDRCYTLRAQKEARQYVDGKLNSILNSGNVCYPGTTKPLQRLSTQTEDNRHTFLIIGPPACGKGTIVATMEIQAKDEFGVDWDDTVKINTDNHRDIVSHADGMGPDRTIHSALNNFEASYIALRAYARVQEQLASGQGHHLIIDGVSPTKGRLDMGIQDSGLLHIAFVSVPVDISLERAFKRAAKDGRYVASDYIIGAHKSISNDFLKTITDTCTNTKTELSVFNTDVPFGTQPIHAMQLNMSTRSAIIYDADSMAMIYGRRNVNAKAKSKEQLFADDEDKLDYSYVTELESLGIAVTYASEEMEEEVMQKIKDSSHPMLR